MGGRDSVGFERVWSWDGREEGHCRFKRVRSQEDGGGAVGPMAAGVFDLHQCSPSSIARKMSSKASTCWFWMSCLWPLSFVSVHFHT